MTVVPDAQTAESGDENPWAKIVMDYGRYFLLGVIAFSAILIVGQRYSSTKQAQASRDYLEASLLQDRVLRSTGSQRLSNISELETLLERRPELREVYLLPLVQNLLAHGEVSSATALLATAPDFISQLDGKVPEYVDFGKATLSVIDGQNADALAATAKLQQHLDAEQLGLPTAGADLPYGELLYGYNLLRLAFIQQSLGDDYREFQAWESFKKSLELNEMGLPTTISGQKLFSNFKEGQVTLGSYITARQSVLSSRIAANKTAEQS